jgi:hypothetical protein
LALRRNFGKSSNSIAIHIDLRQTQRPNEKISKKPGSNAGPFLFKRALNGWDLEIHTTHAAAVLDHEQPLPHPACDQPQ